MVLITEMETQTETFNSQFNESEIDIIACISQHILYESNIKLNNLVIYLNNKRSLIHNINIKYLLLLNQNTINLHNIIIKFKFLDLIRFLQEDISLENGYTEEFRYISYEIFDETPLNIIYLIYENKYSLMNTFYNKFIYNTTDERIKRYLNFYK